MSPSAAVIGGGFYGASIAHYLKTRRGFDHVTLLEREGTLLARASYHNQARVHNGYHYPRSLTTALRSRLNLPRFVADYPAVVRRDFTKLYAIPRQGSKVTATQFLRFCREIGAAIQPAEASHTALFDSRLIEGVFLAEEYGFDAAKLRAHMEALLKAADIDMRLNCPVSSLTHTENGVQLQLASGETLAADYVFNCGYSGLNQLAGDFPGTRTAMKHEITEMVLLILPPALEGLGITVMDGPFFSVMPFPDRALHTLSHVRYTPHCGWQDAAGENPYTRLAAYPKASRANRMLRDAARYLPGLAQAEVQDSLWEVKTVLVKNESDDGRPILFERHASLPRCYSVLGGKIDNIYDMLEKLDAEDFA